MTCQKPPLKRLPFINFCPIASYFASSKGRRTHHWLFAVRRYRRFEARWRLGLKGISQLEFAFVFISTNRSIRAAIHNFQLSLVATVATRVSFYQLASALSSLLAILLLLFTIKFGFRMSAKDIYYGAKYPDDEKEFEYR